MGVVLKFGRTYGLYLFTLDVLNERRGRLHNKVNLDSQSVPYKSHCEAV
jgi:hypothetical protein